MELDLLDRITDWWSEAGTWQTALVIAAAITLPLMIFRYIPEATDPEWNLRTLAALWAGTVISVGIWWGIVMAVRAISGRR